MRTYGLGLLGTDRRVAALARRLGEGSPYAHGTFRLMGNPGQDTLETVLPRDDIHVVYLGCPPEQRAQAAMAALMTGKAVVSAMPLATDGRFLDALAALNRRAPLVVTTDLRCTLAGRSALRIAAAGELGALHSIYIAQRWQAWRGTSAAGEAWEHTERLWETVDYSVALGGGRLYAVAAELNAGSGEAIVFNARFAGDVIATVEVGAVLARGCGVTDPEVEIEVAGSSDALRAEPYRQAVSVSAFDRGGVARGLDARGWHNDPAVNMLAALEEVLEGGTAPEAMIGVEQHRAVSEAVAQITKLAGKR